MFPLLISWHYATIADKGCLQNWHGLDAWSVSLDFARCSHVSIALPQYCICTDAMQLNTGFNFCMFNWYSLSHSYSSYVIISIH